MRVQISLSTMLGQIGDVMLSGWYKAVLHVPGHLRLLGKTCLICGVSTDVAATVARGLAVEGCKLLAADESRNDLLAGVGHPGRRRFCSLV